MEELNKNISKAANYGLTLYQKKLSECLDSAVRKAIAGQYDVDHAILPYFESRMNNAFSSYQDQLLSIFEWMFVSRENTNYTYDLKELNKKQLCGFIANITDISLEKAREYIDELENDHELKSHIINLTSQNKEFQLTADLRADYGRRLGWYALIRAKKPKLVVETGVDKGIGSCIIASALIKNNQEGFEGKYIGTDINQHAGYLYQGVYSETGEILYGDSVESLKKIDTNIDFFINDSYHTEKYETHEYEAIRDKLDPKAIILGDNSHATDSLYEFAVSTDRKFLFFRESPDKHWYLGAGIGAAFV